MRRWSGSAKPGFHVRQRCWRIGSPVVTTLSRSVPVLENNLLRYGLDRRCARVRDVRRCWSWTIRPRMPARASAPRNLPRADEDGAEAIVLDCAGMADPAASLVG